MIVNSPKFYQPKFALKYFERRAEVIHQFIIAKSLVSIHSPKFHPFNILPCVVLNIIICNKYCMVQNATGENIQELAPVVV